MGFTLKDKEDISCATEPPINDLEEGPQLLPVRILMNISVENLYKTNNKVGWSWLMHTELDLSVKPGERI